jgi:hypothetical protein
VLKINAVVAAAAAAADDNGFDNSQLFSFENNLMTE